MRQCLTCTTVYADATACPHCGSTEGDDMAKISVHGGPTDHTAPAVEEEKPTPEETVEAPVEDRPVEEETVEALGELLAEVVPEGTVDEVIAWTEDDPSPPARLVTALDAEQAKPTPRVTLVTELERRLAQF